MLVSGTFHARGLGIWVAELPGPLTENGHRVLVSLSVAETVEAFLPRTVAGVWLGAECGVGDDDVQLYKNNQSL